MDMCHVKSVNNNEHWWENPQNYKIYKRNFPESETNGFHTVVTPLGKDSLKYKVIRMSLFCNLHSVTEV